MMSLFGRMFGVGRWRWLDGGVFVGELGTLIEEKARCRHATAVECFRIRPFIFCNVYLLGAEKLR